MKTIIVYYTFTGNNKSLAEELQKRLDCDIFQVKSTKKRTNFTILLELFFRKKSTIKESNLKLNQYDNIILIAPIYDYRIAGPLKAFIKKEKDNINKYSFITICTGRKGQNEKIKNELIQLTEKEPQTVVELEVNDLLPPEKQNKIKHTSSYRIQEKDLKDFEKKIEQFIETIN